MIVTSSSRPAHFRVSSTDPGPIPSSIALPKIQGPSVSGSCHSTPTAVVSRISRHCILRNHRSNAAGVRVSGAGPGFSPAAL